MVAVDADKFAHKEGQNENKPGHKQFSQYKVPDWVRHPLKDPPRRVALIFPGEQNHYVGMLKEVRKKPAVQAMLEKASEVCGFDVEATMKDGPASEMKATGVNQPLMYVANCAALEVLRERLPEDAEKCQAVAGFSVGEISALYAAGVITFEQGLEVVSARASAMQELADSVEMEAIQIRGLPMDKLERIMKTATKLDTEQGSEPEMHIARYWCPEGFVVAGKRSTVLKLQTALEREAKQAEVRVLPDHIHAAHTPMAKEAEEHVAAVWNRLLPLMSPPRCEVYLNQTGWRVPAGASPHDFIDALKSQLSEPLLWDSCVTQMMRFGVRQFYECGPSRSLKFMMNYFELFKEAPVEFIRPGEFTTNVLV